MTLPKYAPNYAAWRLAELLKAVQDRTGVSDAMRNRTPLPTHLDRSRRGQPEQIRQLRNCKEHVDYVRKLRNRKERRHCIRKLRQLDRNATFNKFMNLPAELRLGVYRDLFPDVPYEKRPERRENFAAILQTCGQVRKEVEGVMYEERVFDLTMSCKSLSHGMHVKTKGYDLGSGDVPRPYAPLKRLMRVTRLNLAFKLARRDFVGEATDSHQRMRETNCLKHVNEELWRVCSALMGSSRLREVHITVDVSAWPFRGNSSMNKAFFPLTLLASLGQRGVDVHLDVPRSMERYMTKYRVPKERGDTVGEVSRLECEAARMLERRPPEEAHTHRRFRTVVELSRLLEGRPGRTNNHGLVTRRHYAAMESYREGLQTFFDSDDVRGPQNGVVGDELQKDDEMA